MAFCDSHLFTISDQGVPFHKRGGDTYADKTINGVSLDDTIMWENEMWHLVPDQGVGSPTTIGCRSITKEISEKTSSPGKEKGEGKFYRGKNSPNKKNKFQTKPKLAWHKRLSKLAQELGDIEMHTEENE